MLGQCDLCQGPAAVYHGQARCIGCTRRHGLPSEVQAQNHRAARLRAIRETEDTIRRRARWGHTPDIIARALRVPLALVERVLR